MAVRFSAGLETLLRTTGVFDNDNVFSWCGWVYAVTLPGVGNYASILSINDNGVGNEDTIYFKGTTGSNKRLVVGMGDSGGFQETVGTTAIATATWYFVALVRSNTTTTLGYLGTLDAAAALEVTESHSAVSRSTPTRMEIGDFGSAGGSPFDGRVYNPKFFDKVLTLAELQLEQFVTRPIALPAWGWWPTFAGATERARDYSGNGRNWTENGTLSDEDQPPISWGAGPWLVINPVAAGGVTVDLSADPAIAAWSAVDPTVILSSITIDLSGDPAVANWSANDPTVILGSLTLDLSADPAIANWSAVDPTIVLGSVVVDLSADPASATWSANDPTVILGSLTLDLSGDPATATWSANDPTIVIGDGNITLDLSDDPATANWSAVDPTVILGSVTVDLSGDPAIAVWSAIDPTVSLGGLIVDLSGDPAIAIWSAADPTVILGSLAIDLSGDVATAAWTAIDPTIVLSSMTVDLSADPALAVWSALDPTVIVAAAAAAAFIEIIIRRATGVEIIHRPATTVEIAHRPATTVEIVHRVS